jgi:hypothetical protein
MGIRISRRRASRVADDGKGLRDIAIGVGSGFATAATAIAAIVGVLHETGYLGAPAPPPAVVITAAAPPAATPALSAQAVASTAPSPAAASTAVARIVSATHEVVRRRHGAQPGASKETAKAHPTSRPEALAMAPEAKPSIPAPAEPVKIAPGASLAAVQPAPAGIPALDGAWRDHGPGFCHVIKQSGGEFEIVNMAPITNSFISVGHGTINGREVHLHLNDHRPTAAQAELYLSDDGQLLTGTIRRPNGEFPLRWYRSGTNCAEK